jgi:polysaccharide pyruvyl transferase WcaK-like protein
MSMSENTSSYCLSERLPAVGIAYHEKTRALLEQVGQGDYVLDTANFTTQELIEKIRALCVNAAESKREIA